jgi:DNA-binding transcriptional LysR family regulator
MIALELRDIEYFCVIAEHLNLGRAAEALGLSQPALSMSLRRLEESMQAKLVKRTPKGVELTVVGAALLARVPPLRLSLGDVAREAADLSQGRSGHVRVGATPEFAEYLLPPALRALFAFAPNATVAVSVASPDALRPVLLKGELDLIITGIGAPRPGMIHVPLFDDGFVVIASASHRLAQRKSVTIPDLAIERWAAAGPEILAWKWLNQMCKNHGLLPPQLAMQSNSAWVRLLSIASTELLGFSSARFLAQVASHLPLTVIHVPESTWARRMGVSRRKDAYLPPAAMRLIEILQEVAREVSADGC